MLPGQADDGRTAVVLRALAELGMTGGLGPVFCGASLADIIAVLGQPCDAGPISERHRWPRLFAYGDVELCVCRCRLVTLICVQAWRESIDMPGPGPGMIDSFPGA